MTKMELKTKKLKSSQGATLVEYVLLIATIALVCISALTFLGKKIDVALKTTADGIGSGSSGGGCNINGGLCGPPPGP